MNDQYESPLHIYRSSFNIINIIKTSYRYTKGFKLTIWKIAITWGVIFFILYKFTGLFLPDTERLILLDTEMYAEQLKQNMMIFGFVSTPIFAPLTTGVIMTIISYLRDEYVSYKSIFKYYSNIWILSLASLIVHSINKIVFFFINTIGDYLHLAWTTVLAYALSAIVGIMYIFTLPLIVDKELKIWEAMELSRKAVFSHFFSIVILYLLLSIILVISAIPLGIGIIWTVPMFLIAFYGLPYRTIFDGVCYDGEEKIVT